MHADSTFVIREELLEEDGERERKAREWWEMRQTESIGSGILFDWGIIILLKYQIRG